MLSVPVHEELRPAPSPSDCFARLAALPHSLFLDSARRDSALGRYSFLAADPFAILRSRSASDDTFGELASRLAEFRTGTIPGLPPFQGGAAGLLSYDLGRQLERLPLPAFDEFECPFAAIGFYDVVLAFDHLQDKAWIVSQGFPEIDADARRRRAAARLEEFKRRLGGPPALANPISSQFSILNSQLARASLAPRHSTPGSKALLSNFTKDGYLSMVARAIEYIKAGDVFQVNLAQRLLHPALDDSAALYLRLRERNPATFSAYFDLGDFQIVSASPERFLKVAGGEVEARPIKGTRPRSRRPEADLFSGDELFASEKDRAENVMIVDLLRNDLSRVCECDSVRVTQLCGVETYEYVQHLVSAIRGRLRPGQSAVDLLKAAFPGGSITGAPKVRAMEIIAELEPTARGAYCGSLGYIGFDGSLDTSILIRTITAGRGWWQLPVGGGITAQSVPEREFAETWDKAEGMVRGLN